MAPSTITEDYYKMLEVHQNADLGLITKSYRRLALKLHPDRNPGRDSTKAFQEVWALSIERNKVLTFGSWVVPTTL